MVTAPPITKFDRKMYQAALAHYGLPDNYNRTFEQVPLTHPKPGGPTAYLCACSVESASRAGKAVWVQVNQPRDGSAKNEKGYPKKAKNEDIEYIANLTLDFEYPPAPSKALEVGTALAAYLIEQGLAEPDLPIENSGAGPHIVDPLPAIKTTPETAKQLNDAVRAVVKKYIEPTFLRLSKEAGIEMDLGGYDLSRVLSAPGTYRPPNPEKPDCEALKQGHLRCWLAPYIDGNYPTRKECTKLAELIREEFEHLNPTQWLHTYALEHPNHDRSGLFQSLVNAAYLKFDEHTVTSLKDDVNYLAGEKYNGRLDEEFNRALEKAKSLPKIGSSSNGHRRELPVETASAEGESQKED